MRSSQLSNATFHLQIPLKEVLKLSLRAVLIIISLGIFPSIGLYAWWHAPVTVKADTIEIIKEKENERGVINCAITKERFVEFWKTATPIFQYELHDYDESASCIYISKENGKKYEIFSGGIGMISDGNQTYFYIKKGMQPVDMNP